MIEFALELTKWLRQSAPARPPRSFAVDRSGDCGEVDMPALRLRPHRDNPKKQRCIRGSADRAAARFRFASCVLATTRPLRAPCAPTLRTTVETLRLHRRGGKCTPTAQADPQLLFPGAGPDCQTCSQSSLCAR